MRSRADIEINVDTVPANKNADGRFGPKCENCGGFGFTLGISGRDHGCMHCEQTGVARMSAAELQASVIELKQELASLKAVIVKALGDK